MRGWIVVLAGTVGCAAADISLASEGSGARSECTRDADCAAAGLRCCDCPTFAVPITSPAHEACAGVTCPDPHCPDRVAPVCAGGRCVLACTAIECPQSCIDGFARDDSCLTCACAQPTATGCLQADDCVRVRADCCGCDHGGRDTAVLRQDAGAHDAALQCPDRPLCPRASTCDPAATLQCIQRRCVLSSVALPPGACGRFDLPPCPSPQACVINGDPTADEEGVGVCMVRQ
jgi:hypothetical protein